tara:strand:- start:267 stop:1040 length:774 start_codon:yes stop_codon:yes gene_type:complete
MDFAKLVTDYLNQRTEGDPSFIVSEESIAFVDLMRADDMDRRASSVESNTSADARGEPSAEEVTDESRRDSVSESHSDAQASSPEESPEVITTPASPFTDVALGGNQDAGVLSDMQEAETEPSPSSVFSEDGQQSQPAAATSESQQSSEPAAVFTEDGNQAAPNSSLQEEGVTVREHITSKSETTVLEPPSMPDFETLLQSFDRDYRPPDPPAGDTDMIPQEEDPEPSEPLQNTTEFCESMMSEILSTHLAYDRRGA